MTKESRYAPLESWMQPCVELDQSWDTTCPNERLEAVLAGGRALRQRLLAGPQVRYYQTFDLAKIPYPRRYALRDACALKLPYVHILNRLFVMQFDSPDGVKTLLGEPLDRLGSAKTPFFDRLSRPFGGPQARVPNLLWPPRGVVEACLDTVGIGCEQVDYITFDHLHTQDIRRWLGTADTPAVFPNAKLLVTRKEWAIARAPVGYQRDWYPPQGTVGVPQNRVILFDCDLDLGGGVCLVRTPGHTDGNHSIVAHTPDGLLVTSENGVCADAYAPQHSRIPGLRRYAGRTGMKVVLNGNTLDGSTQQYISMLLERELAGPCPQDPRFYNVYPSSELSPHWLSPGLRPAFRFGERRYGQPV